MSAVGYLQNHKKSEATEQIMVMEWATRHEDVYPELELLHHVPNGGKRTAAEAPILKLMGVKRGIPDLCMPVPKGCYKGMYIEMKYGENRLSPEQKEMLKKLDEQGHYVCVCYSAMAAVQVLENYLRLSDCQMLTMLNRDGTMEHEGKVQIFR